MKVFAFDFDGVILDSTKFLAENYKNFLRNYGITPSEEDLDFFFSNTIDKIIEYLNEKYKINVDKKIVEDYFFKKEKEFLNGFRNSEHIKDLKEIINILQNKGFKVIILSHSPFERINYAINVFGIKNLFDEIISDERIMTDKVDYFKDYIHYNKVKEAYLLDDSPKIVAKAKVNNIKPIFYYNPLRMNLESAKKFAEEINIPLIKDFKELKSFVKNL
jgi:phosphoglycolate phosphatase-like HAD superfamily hydrolase